MKKNDHFRPTKIFKNLPKIGIFLTDNGTKIAKLNSYDFVKMVIRGQKRFLLRNYFFNVFMKKLGENWTQKTTKKCFEMFPKCLSFVILK